ncbi:hypothetical protein F2Q70_00040615 [Brassica cretica]|uniref:Uncharacterized protein n=1 Tax=Brassica cretica TaxID=69181 RepID=A0A8S9K184_BRACR|nr:hypothetical protein F2Q70_00040615 [Brassica cretica]
MTFHLFTKKPTIEPETRRPPPHTPSSGVVRRLHVPPSTSLSKQHSWSPDLIREEAWSKRRDTSRNRRRGKSLTDDDLDELKASIELGFGFGFGSPEVTDPRLSNTLPALELYYAVQKSYNDAEAWSKRRDTSRNRRRGKSLTDDDLDELKASIELGFGFGSPEVTDPRLSNTLPALELYYAVQKSYNDAVSNKSSSSLSEGDTSPSTLYRTSDDPQTVKTKLKQWARVVACTVNQSPPR